MEDDLNVVELTQRVYGKGSEYMLSLVKSFWYQSGPFPGSPQWIDRSLTDTARYCQFTKKNPVATLESMSINVLYAFFDWLLRERKDSLGAASSLQTYWNAFCLLRRQETGRYQIDPLIKSQIYRV